MYQPAKLREQFGDVQGTERIARGAALLPGAPAEAPAVGGRFCVGWVWCLADTTFQFLRMIAWLLPLETIDDDGDNLLDALPLAQPGADDGAVAVEADTALLFSPPSSSAPSRWIESKAAGSGASVVIAPTGGRTGTLRSRADIGAQRCRKGDRRVRVLSAVWIEDRSPE
ncbi:hypothetical protein ABGN05_17045 [Aquibium sp. LZ166]|uniref:Uncharacterized protein n=1 Tax=Aquibium pacificus TaxID=3153579 RepID=A0ABV3SKS0_9HYPH